MRVRIRTGRAMVRQRDSVVCWTMLYYHACFVIILSHHKTPYSALALASPSSTSMPDTSDPDHVLPPALPADSVYTGCYCEENVYLLAQALGAGRFPIWDVYAIFISNASKTVRRASSRITPAIPFRISRPEEPRHPASSLLKHLSHLQMLHFRTEIPSLSR
jgi:hypothetical protein